MKKEEAEDILVEAMILGTSKAIENQEARGQSAFVNSTLLPKRWQTFDSLPRDEWFERVGIKVIKSHDDLFDEVSLPDGWEKRSTDHSMWSNLVDEQGRVRAKLFYRASFIERRANACVKGAIEYCYADREIRMWDKAIARLPEWSFEPATEGLPASYDPVDSIWRKAWLEHMYPEWQNRTAYWDAPWSLPIFSDGRPKVLTIPAHGSGKWWWRSPGRWPCPLEDSRAKEIWPNYDFDAPQRVERGRYDLGNHFKWEEREDGKIDLFVPAVKEAAP